MRHQLFAWTIFQPFPYHLTCGSDDRVELQAKVSNCKEAWKLKSLLLIMSNIPTRLRNRFMLFNLNARIFKFFFSFHIFVQSKTFKILVIEYLWFWLWKWKQVKLVSMKPFDWQWIDIKLFNWMFRTHIVFIISSKTKRHE